MTHSCRTKRASQKVAYKTQGPNRNACGRALAGGGVRLVAGLGLALLLAACGSMPTPTYNLSAPSGFSAGGRGSGQLIVATPSALAVLNTDKIMVEPGGGQVAYLGMPSGRTSCPPCFRHGSFRPSRMAAICAVSHGPMMV